MTELMQRETVVASFSVFVLLHKCSLVPQSSLILFHIIYCIKWNDISYKTNLSTEDYILNCNLKLNFKFQCKVFSVRYSVLKFSIKYILIAIFLTLKRFFLIFQPCTEVLFIDIFHEYNQTLTPVLLEMVHSLQGKLFETYRNCKM